MPIYTMVEHEGGRAGMRRAQRSILRAVGLLVSVFLGCAGLLLLFDRRTDADWQRRVFDALWNAANTITTLGDFTDLTREQQWVMIGAMIGIVIGGGYALTSLTGILNAPEITAYRENKRTGRMLSDMKDHLIVVGYGDYGRLIADAAKAGGDPVLIIEQDETAAAQASAAGHIVIVGQANLESTLQSARIGEAKGIVITIDEMDRRLSITLMARGYNSALHILVIARGTDGENWLMRAGASEVIRVDKLVADTLLRHYRATAHKGVPVAG